MKRATADSAADLLTTDQVMDRLLADENASSLTPHGRG